LSLTLCLSHFVSHTLSLTLCLFKENLLVSDNKTAFVAHDISLFVSSDQSGIGVIGTNAQITVVVLMNFFPRRHVGEK
jgi:hypothetical protein